MTTSWYPLDRDELRALFDLVVSTTDFGSSFFESDDVMLLRKLAEALGIDSMEGTPSDNRKHIAHAFSLLSGSDTAPTGLLRDGPPVPRCRWCNKAEDDQVHGGDA